MSILIKDMEMPEGCYCCPLAHRNYNFKEDMTQLGCYATDRWASDDGEKPEWCPLIEVPPHGRLIDADALIQKFENSKLIMSIFRSEIVQIHDEICNDMIEELNNAPTVIPADKDGEA